ncbi:hypothetical protein ASF55_10605 [Methylobacterium sp. Leaf119]|nr:hypothetical protein ASF55_10605 [Methylobacterium sp. Leaf119]
MRRQRPRSGPGVAPAIDHRTDPLQIGDEPAEPDLAGVPCETHAPGAALPGLDDTGPDQRLGDLLEVVHRDVEALRDGRGRDPDAPLGQRQVHEQTQAVIRVKREMQGRPPERCRATFR